VAHHPVGAIKTYFQNLGGQQVDLTTRDTSVSFIYRSPIAIETSALDTNACGDAMLAQYIRYRLDVGVFETYGDERCYLDSVNLIIDDQISDETASVDTTFRSSTYRHFFYAMSPNILAPYQKAITITAKDPLAENRIVTTTLSAAVTGKRERPTQFATTSPEMPMMVLRDPPGDMSYSYLEKGQEHCSFKSFYHKTDRNSDATIKLSLGPTYSTEAAGFGFEVDRIEDLSFGTTRNNSYTSEYEQETCLSFTETISTSDSKQIVGSEMGGDVYYGAAINLVFGIHDELLYNDSLCSYQLDTTMFVRDDGFATQYLYSEHHILNDLIPDLQILNDTQSVRLWQEVIQKNTEAKAKAVFDKNLSFNGGTIYDYKSLTEVSKTERQDFSVMVSESFARESGIYVAGLGFGGEFRVDMQHEYGESKETTKRHTTEVGYHLEDSDTRDVFTLDILNDGIYGTPVFNVKSGQSSCPHEPGTQNRDEVFIQVDESVQANVPETEEAFFNIKLGNNSPSKDQRTYFLTLENDSNPNGATVRINGFEVSDLLFELKGDETADVVVTISKGPEAYDYENLELIFYAACERERALELGTETDSLFEQRIQLSAHFIESCSDINISSPMPGWVITPADNNQMAITLDGYEIDDTDLELVRLQYRPTDGNGAWINIVELPKDSLGPLYEVVHWDVSALADGPFELRAVTQCQGNLPAGIANTIVGKLERQPPSLLGTPSPADGILHAADAISIQFTEIIECNNLTSLPDVTEDFVGLFDAATGQPIDATISCLGNTIIIVPAVQNKFIENKTLRAEVRGIKDLVGNAIPNPITWEFYVDRNPLKWVEGDVKAIKYEDNSWKLTRTIENLGGQNASFSLEEVPNWLIPSTTSGEVAPGGTSAVVFTVSDQLANGQYHDTIQLTSVMGQEPLSIELAALCRQPEWTINPSAFNYNM
ncbi:MAG: Ig-like domain-containing protein, partial [Bacteroidota bacterium]